MQGQSSNKNKAKYDDYGFMDLIFSWSIEDILNEDLYKNKIMKIELSFLSIDHYRGSYMYPLLEETRAQLCSSMDIIQQAPYAEVRGIKEAKPYENKLYNLKIDSWKNRFAHNGEPYKTLPGDVLILADYKPEAVKDLQRNRRFWSFVSTVWTKEDEDGSMSVCLKVKASKDIDLQELRNKTLFLIFLTNVNPNRRIWGALHIPGNLKLLTQILCKKDEVEECCSCSSLADNLRYDCSYQRLLSDLNESQKKAISACLSGLNCNHNSVVKLIWGPPGTGKTRTLATLLFALMKMKYRVLVCAPTNVAIKEVATRVVNIMKEAHSKEYGDLLCSLGDLLLFGNNERLRIGDDIEDIYLDHRVQQLTKCYSHYTGFSSCLESMIDLLENCVSKYDEYVQNLENLFSFQNLPWMKSWSFGGAAEQLYNKRTECLIALMTVKDSLDGFMMIISSSKEDEIREFCFQTSSLIFSTASGSHKLHNLAIKPLNILVIDEAAMLKECESIIPSLLPGISHAILVGDECQLPPMVRMLILFVYKISDEAGFGRSLFQRLSSLGYTKYLLDMQHRMHPQISSFPNSYFYSNKIQDAPNVERSDYGKQYLPGPMFGPYSFINIIGGKEQFDDAGRSYKNMAEVAVVMTILKNLHKAWLGSKQKLSIGIVSPYAGQIVAIEKKLGQFYESHDGFKVNVKSVDGFQGGEHDVIILSTVRTNSRTFLEFISSPQRTNVALTRARHCLWILGNERALTHKENVWKAIVLDAKKRNCFFDADRDEQMAKAILDARKESDEFDDLLDSNSDIFKNALWKVHFNDKFRRSFKRLRSNEIKKKVINLLGRLSSGWRPKKIAVDLSCENSSQILKQFKVESFYIICSIDIVKTSRYIQVLKIWDILPVEDIPQLAKRLDNVFKGYTNEYIIRCKEKGSYKYNGGNIEFPLNWPLSAKIQKFESVHNNPNEGETCANEEVSDDENSKVEECMLLMKYCSISRRSLLYGQDGVEVDLPYEVTDEQRNIILYPQSTFVLGRSGTGKTTVLITKLIQNEKLHHMAVEEVFGSKIHVNPEESKEIASETEKPVLRQLFVTLSPGLCRKVQHHVSLLKRYLVFS
uniref:Helicase SEN1 n=1 Tax=Cajanus cajan TaxID=3821 RepID=A0A151RA81_CAJCA|nr:Helicase SEN1 [Cajanus cajan]